MDARDVCPPLHTMDSIWELCQRTMWRTAYRILGNREDSEDAVMDAVVRMAKNITKLEMLEDGELIALSVIYTRHTAIDIFNRNSRRPIPVEEMDDPAEEDSDPQEITILGDLEDIVYRLLLEMPAGMRDVMNLSVHYGMENREIAEALRLPEGTVRTRLSRGRKWLKKKLTEKGVMLS